MANYVHSELIIDGKMKDIREFQEGINEMVEESKKHENITVNNISEEFDICQAFWGKISCDWEKRKGINNNHIVYELYTKWIPPIPIINIMGKKFPNLSFILMYDEEELNFQGVYIIDDGNIKEDRCLNYESDVEDQQVYQSELKQNPKMDFNFTVDEMLQIFHDDDLESDHIPGE